MPASRVDSSLAKQQLQGLQFAVQNWGMRSFLSTFFWILTKFQTENSKLFATRLIPFKLNRIQRQVDRTLAKNNIFGKPRQSGFTTYLSIRRLLVPAIIEGGIGSLLISQNGEYVAEHFRIAQRAYKFIGCVDPFDASKNAYSNSLKANLLHTAYSNKRELVFDYLDSKIRVASAEVEESGQGITLHHIVADEYARWPKNPEATLANVRGALVPGGTVDLSSTANGAGGPFFEATMRALDSPEDSDAKLHFFPWWWEDSYVESELTPSQRIELAEDLTADELRIIAKIHHEMKAVTFPSKVA